MTPLHALARDAGLLATWEDYLGEKQRVADESLRTILERLGVEAGSDPAIEESRKRLRAERSARLDPLITAHAGKTIALPKPMKHHKRAVLWIEGGQRLDVDLSRDLKIAEPGYHRLELDDAEVTIAVAPTRGFTVDDAAPGRRLWAPTVQIPSLRDRRGEAFGDFGAVARYAVEAARHGADALAISPAHALFPADASRYSPYAPSTRLFLNVLLGDPSLLGEKQSTKSSPAALIDWESAAPDKLRRLRALFDDRSDAVRQKIGAFRRQGGEPLERHATYDALYAHFFGSPHRGGWQAWPSEYHDPAGEAAARFSAEHRGDIEFYLFLQWLADTSLAGAQRSARGAGMAIGLIADIAVGMDAGGSHAWSARDQLLTGLSVGAPPDQLGPDGQDWGITTFSPHALPRTGFQAFLATVRAALRHAGGIRIDHALGLKRLWVVPHGAKSSQGAYLMQPQQDLMRLLALESWRHRAILVGEDLGTVPPGFRDEMSERGMMGMRVLWFERTASGGFTAPGRYTPAAAAMTTTHDLPTVAGWWGGRDIDWSWRLGRTSRFPDEAAEHAARGLDRKRLWASMRRAGVVAKADPEPEQPALAVGPALAFVAAAASELAILPTEDLLGLEEQPNLPGTTTEHPNWRRRLPALAETMLDAPEVTARLNRINKARRG